MTFASIDGTLAVGFNGQTPEEAQLVFEFLSSFSVGYERHHASVEFDVVRKVDGVADA